MKRLLTGLTFLFYCAICSIEPTHQRLTMLYNSLDPSSISQHLAFYELYQPHPLSQKALNDLFYLLSGRTSVSSTFYLPFTPTLIDSLVDLVNKPTDKKMSLIDEENLKAIEQFAKRLHHVHLKGHFALKEEDILALPTEEVDLARGLFLSQFRDDLQRIRSYEALIDLMALQILVRLPSNATPADKISKINKFIFEEMGFRFPPRSLHTKEIDVYTFLPSVLDSHRGVCLGVSILYMCIAQRLDLPLEMMTPPGHIYVRYSDTKQTINIETTARGIDVESQEYLSVNTRSLQKRTVKQVIGLAHFNQASVFWQNGHYEKAYQAYLEAKKYMGNDPLLNELLGFVCLFNQRQEEGESLLKTVHDYLPDHAVSKSTVAEDYFLGNVDANGIKAVFSHQEEDRSSILAKKNELEEVVKKHPKFRTGLLCLAMTWMQLYRPGEALEILKDYYVLYPQDPEANFYLATLYAQRLHYQKAWDHLKQAEEITSQKNYHPKLLKDLRKALQAVCPE